MRRDRFKALALTAGAVAALAMVAFGVRLVRGSRMPQGQSPEAAAQHYADLARHREAQSSTSPGLGAGAQNTRSPAVIPDGSSPTIATAAPPYWTDFRGPQRDGHYRERPIFTAWSSAALTPLWKQPVGGGHASFVAAQHRAFTIEQRGGEEVVAAYDLRSGREVWTHAWAAAFRELRGGEGPRATPTWHDGRVVALGATGELRVIDAATGKQRWRTNILEDAGASNLEWGMAASPLIVDDNVIVLPGGPGGQSVAAYNLETGRRAWSALDDRQSFSSPMVATIAGVRQILVFSASRLVGITTGGTLLWEFPWISGGASSINASQPIVLGDRVFLSTGYGTGAVMIHLSREGGGFTVRELWRTNRMKNQFTSSVHHDGYIYGLDESILACIDAASGELKWKGGRYGYGQVMLASEHLIVVTEEGDLALVKATPERHVEVARFPAIAGRTWNHPALSDGILLIRNINEMAAFDLNQR